MRKIGIIFIAVCTLFYVCLRADAGSVKNEFKNTNRIRPYEKNPRYWQYKGKPVLLLGGTKDDNLFQIPDLKEHLDLLTSVGGNYIRNTMSGRIDKGFEVPAFKRLPDGKYDLDQWNDEYWNRFENLLKWTGQRDIIVQIEVWAFHDFNKGQWEKSPWYPANNINYNSSNTTLRDSYGNIGQTTHDFFYTVPKLHNDDLVLAYQQKFVDKILSYSLEYGHVLYCMTNEIHPQFSPEWGWYWSEYIKEKATASGSGVETTEMYWEIDLKKPQQAASLDRPDVFSFFEASQNSAIMDQQNWDNLKFVHHYLANPGKEYAIYFPDSGEVKLDINPMMRLGTIRWLEISTSKWGERQELKPAQSVTLCPPKSGSWTALLVESGVADAGLLDSAIEDKVVVDVLRVHPKNPLYFTVDSQEAIFLGGHQIFVDLQDNTYNKPFTRNKEKTLDWPAYLAFLESTNMNYLRNWIIFSTGSGSMAPINKAVAKPMPYLRVPGHGKANDGGLKFDLYKFNDAFFQRLYKRCKDLEERNIYVSIMLFEVYGFGNGEKCGDPPQNLWDGNMFNSANNINGIDTNLDKDNTGLEFFYTKDAKILDLQKAYIKKIIDILNPLDNIFYEIANELYTPEWQMSIIDFIKKYEMTKPKHHLVLFSPGGRLADNKWKVIAKDKVINSKADCFACMGNWDSKAFREITPPINNNGKPGIIDLDHIRPGSNNVAYLWTAFTQGYHFNLYETPYDHPDEESPEWVNIRYNIGKAVEYSQKVDLANMKPRPDLSSTKFCLAKEGCEYIIYQQSKSEFTVSGLEPGKRYNLEWYAAGKNESESGSICPETSEVTFIPKYENMVLFVQLPNL